LLLSPVEKFLILVSLCPYSSDFSLTADTHG